MLLPPELQQMGESCRGFRPAADRRWWQGPEIARDERVIDVGKGVSMLREPLPKRVARPQYPPDTIGGIPLLVQGGGEGIQVGA